MDARHPAGTQSRTEGAGTLQHPSPSQPQTLRLLVSSPAKESARAASRSSAANEPQSVLGGKASCRRKFVLNVMLVDEQGRLVELDMSITASLTYSHDHSPVKVEEGQTMVEPPLFTTFNGVEFPAHLRPSQMLAGKASFKLALSVLSSKCDNRLFSVRFTATGQIDQQHQGALLINPGFSDPIRSISRKRSRASLLSWGGSPPAPPPSLHFGPRPPALSLSLHNLAQAESSAHYSPHTPKTELYSQSPPISFAPGTLSSSFPQRPTDIPSTSDYTPGLGAGSTQYPSSKGAAHAPSPLSLSQHQSDGHGHETGEGGGVTPTPSTHASALPRHTAPLGGLSSTPPLPP